mgnify:FL=1
MNALTRLRWRRLQRRRDDAGRRCGALRDVLKAALPDPRLPVRDAPLLAVDLEMTGLDSARDAILTIGWVPVDAGAVNVAGGDEIGVAAAPGRGVGDSAVIHGIRDCDRGATPPAEALFKLLQAAVGRVAVFHHAPLDLGFLERALHEAFGVGWLWPWIDTLDWERRRRRDPDEHVQGASRLDALRDRFGLGPRVAHNALDDALSCAEVALVLAARSRARLGDVCSLPGRARRPTPG